MRIKESNGHSPELDTGFYRCPVPGFFYFRDFPITPTYGDGIPDNNAFERLLKTRSHTKCDLKGFGNPQQVKQKSQIAFSALLAQ